MIVDRRPAPVVRAANDGYRTLPLPIDMAGLRPMTNGSTYVPSAQLRVDVRGGISDAWVIGRVHPATLLTADSTYG